MSKASLYTLAHVIRGIKVCFPSLCLGYKSCAKKKKKKNTHATRL